MIFLIIQKIGIKISENQNYLLSRVLEPAFFFRWIKTLNHKVYHDIIPSKRSKNNCSQKSYQSGETSKNTKI